MPEYQVVGGRIVAKGSSGTATLAELIADLQALRAALALKAEKTELPEVLDTLDSDRTDAALSVAQGKVLNDRKIDKVTKNRIIIVDAANGDDSTADGTEGRPYKTILGAVNSLPIVSAGACTIKIKAGVYETPQITLRAPIGGNVIFQTFSGTKDVEWKSTSTGDAVKAWIFNAHIRVDNIKFTVAPSGSAKNGVVMGLTMPASINNCDFDGFAVCGVYNVFGTMVKINGCSFKNTPTAITTTEGGVLISINNTTIDGVSYGLHSDAGIIFKRGGQPTGSTSNEYKSNGGQIWG